VSDNRLMENGRRALHGGHFHLQGRRGTNSFARKPSAVIGASPGKFGTVSRFSS
jgi:hypothetical protein